MYPSGTFPSLGTMKTSNSTILSISFLIACFHRSFPASLSKAKASLMFLGILTPNLYLGPFICLAIMTCLVILKNFLGFLRYLFAQVQCFCPLSPRFCTYSATDTGSSAFICSNGSHVGGPISHSTLTRTSSLSFFLTILWFMILLKVQTSLPSSSTLLMEFMISSYVCSTVEPSAYSTKKSWFSPIPITVPFCLLDACSPRKLYPIS